MERKENNTLKEKIVVKDGQFDPNRVTKNRADLKLTNEGRVAENRH